MTIQTKKNPNKNLNKKTDQINKNKPTKSKKPKIQY